MYKKTSFSLLILSVAFLFSCTTSKFDFKNAYTFKKYSYQKKDQTDNIKRNNEYTEATASIKPILINPDVSVPNVEVKPIQPIIPEYDAVKYEEMSRPEKKAFKKEIKKELKKIKKAVKNSKKSIKSEDATNAISKWVYVGLIVGGAGLVLLIIDVAATLGAIALVVGLGFIVYGLLHQRGIV